MACPWRSPSCATSSASETNAVSPFIWRNQTQFRRPRVGWVTTHASPGYSPGTPCKAPSSTALSDANQGITARKAPQIPTTSAEDTIPSTA